MKQIKSVRIRPINTNPDERLASQKFSTNLTGSISDIKLTLIEVEESDLNDLKLNITPGTKMIAEWLPISDVRGLVKKNYSSEQIDNFKSRFTSISVSFFSELYKTYYDIIIKDVIDENEKKYKQQKGIKSEEEIFSIVQDPWNDKPPIERRFGSDPYYLNNGAKIDIYWMIDDKFSLPFSPRYTQYLYLYFGYDVNSIFLPSQGPEIIQSTASQINANNIFLAASASGEFKSSPPKGTWIGGQNWSTSGGEEISSLGANGTYLDGAVWVNPENGKLERYPKDKIKKYIIISSPKKGENGTKNDEWLSVKDANIADFGYIQPPIFIGGPSASPISEQFYKKYVSVSVSGLTTSTGLTPSGLTPSGLTPSGLSFSSDNTIKRLAEIPKVNKDVDIISAIIEVWKRKVPNYSKLRLCEPSYFPTLEVEYISPINSGTGSTNTDGDNKGDQPEQKFPLVVDSNNLMTTLSAKKDLPSFKVYVNKIPENDPDNIFTDEIDQFLQDGSGDDEYFEAAYAGEAEEIRKIKIDVQLEKQKFFENSREEFLDHGDPKLGSNGEQVFNKSTIVTGDTSGEKCPNISGEIKDGGVADGYKGGKLVKIRLCLVKTPAGGWCDVNSQIAQQTYNMFQDAKKDGLTLGGGGYRTMDEQIACGKNNNCQGWPNWTKSSQCRPPTAPPGYSNHQMGLAIDVTYKGSCIGSKASEAFKWLNANAGKYGLKNYAPEPWHWSPNGG
jgi:hypothetical protein